MKDSSKGSQGTSPALIALGIVALLIGLAAGLYMSLVGAPP